MNQFVSSLIILRIYIKTSNISDHPVDQDGHQYVGLVNQAMTCYLNSLIQSLFMTPEFRNILYEWQFNGTMEEAARSIPFQLQKLFALLQTTSKASLETKDLTQSFGWEGSDGKYIHIKFGINNLLFFSL